MGWKNVKEHYRIGHSVCVTEQGICIGSPYIHDIIVIGLDGKLKKRYDGGGSNEDLERYQREFDAEPHVLKKLINGPDRFTKDITVYTFSDGRDHREEVRGDRLAASQHLRTKGKLEFMPTQPIECHGLDTAERVCFYEQDFYVLSNFSAFTLLWKGIRFDTSEAAYHYEKFEGVSPAANEVAANMVSAWSAHEALKIATANKHLRRADWDEVKVDIMREILREKVRQHDYVKRKLLATGDRELVENSWRDDFWGWGPNRDGQNVLGKLWMDVRAELRIDAMTPAEVDTYLVSKGFDLAKVDESCAKLRAKLEARGVHGVTCQKAQHDPQRAGYLHEENDDSPYTVDGMRYCGRCHHAL